MNKVSKAKPNYELNKLYLDQLQQQINDKRLHQVMDKNISLLEEKAMLQQQMVRDNMETSRAKQKIIAEKSELTKYQLMHMLQNKNKSKETELEIIQNSSIANLGLASSNDSLPQIYKERFIKHLPKVVENDRYCNLNNGKSEKIKYADEKPKVGKYEGIPLDFIYFKNKELGYSGSLPYSIANQNIESQLKDKYDNRKSQVVAKTGLFQEYHLGNDSLKRVITKERLAISYENALKDINVLSKYKKLQDQKLTKLLLDEQTGRQINTQASPVKDLQQTGHTGAQFTNLENNIIVNPMDNYTHNRYIAKLRNDRGLHWESLT